MTNLLSRLKNRRRTERGDILEVSIGIMTFVIVFLCIVVMLWSAISEKSAEINANEEVSVEESVATEPAPTPVPPAEPVDIPWEIMAVILTVLIGLVITSIGGFHIYKTANKALNHKKQQESTFTQNLLSWANTFKDHDSLLTQWVKYELDVEKLIRYPSLTDVSNPATKNLMEALRQADLSRPAEGDKYKDVAYTAYGKAVKELSTALVAAVSEAKKQAWRNFTSKEQSRLRTALQMLQLAQNSGASVNERQSAYKRVLAEVEGLIVLPEKPIALLEAATLKAIETTPTNQPVFVLN